VILETGQETAMLRQTWLFAAALTLSGLRRRYTARDPRRGLLDRLPLHHRGGRGLRQPGRRRAGAGGRIDRHGRRLKRFCEGVGWEFPDIANASRRMKKSEYDMCQKNNVGEIMEVQIGVDGVALAEATTARS
jgi:phosphate transport system substrate-binding protein